MITHYAARLLMTDDSALNAWLLIVSALRVLTR
jgi:hypothetical protein